MSEFWNDGASLYHYGIPGMKWGERRFQNDDGTLTEEGKIRYGRGGSVGYRDSINARKDYWKAVRSGNQSIRQARQNVKQARKDKKASVRAAYKNIINTENEYNRNLKNARKEIIDSNKGTWRKLGWNAAAVDKAAKYYVNSNSPLSEIRKRVDFEMLRNTAMAGLAIYGMYKLSELKEDKSFMNDLNSRINSGKEWTSHLQENMLKIGDSGGKNPIGSSSTTYWGNDGKMHTATASYKYDSDGKVAETRYYNPGVTTQKEVSLKEARRLRKSK